MELVNGLPLATYCDEAKLSPRERLELFVPICQAVQHAHQKGIVHRDLKPANILVTMVDDRPIPKVIDFGVAKAISGKLTDETLATSFGAILGTLEYMSPEQAGFSNTDIDTRTDIYSLGVVLYELLTGLRPHSEHRLKNAALTEMIRIIQEEEPSKPSTRLSTDGSLGSVAAVRQVDPRRLTAMLRGDLDWVVMKCLEKQRERRYETANALVRDVQRYLAEEPVEARPPSATYRLQKFVRRHLGQVIAANLIGLSLLGGLAGTTAGLFEARKQTERARQETAAKEEARQAEAERAEGERLARLEAQAARDREAQERRYAEAVTDFVKDDLLALTSVEGQRRFGGQELTKDATLQDLLDRAAEKLKDRQNLDPRTQAELNWLIGVSYRGTGDYEKGLPYLERSLELGREIFGPEDSFSLQAQNSLAVSYGYAGHYKKALLLLEELLPVLQSTLGADHPTTLNTMGHLAYAYGDLGQLEKAIQLLEEVVLHKEATLGPDHLETLISMDNLAMTYKAYGDLSKALQLSEDAFARFEAEFGLDHPGTLVSMNTLANIYLVAERLQDALPLMEESTNRSREMLGSDHPSVLASLNNLAMTYWASGQLQKALQMFEESLAIVRTKLGPSHPYTLGAMNNLAGAYRAAEKLDKALLLSEQLFAQAKETLGPTHPNTILSMGNLAELYRENGQLNDALPLYTQLITLRKATFARDDPDTLLSMEAFADLLLELKDFEKAESVLRECLTVHEQVHGDDWQTYDARSRLGETLLGQEKFAEAEPILLDGYEGLKQQEAMVPNEAKPRLIEAIERLVRLYQATKNEAAAAKWQLALEAAGSTN